MSVKRFLILSLSGIICFLSLTTFAQRGGGGGGANTLVRVTNQGLIVVDTKNPSDENFHRLMEEIKSVTDQPVKYVINTHHHPDHVGNNQKFIDAGAQVVALEALKMWMEKDP